jgi:hypothetical protein
MFRFLLISDINNISTSVYQAFSALGVPEKQMEDGLFVESESGMEKGWIAFQPIKDAQYDYEINELEEIKNRISNPSFYLIEGRNGVINFSNDFIKNFVPSGRVFIDNDHGMIADLVEVKGKIEAGEDWLHLSSQ